MEVILLERIEKLGGMGDVVRVKNGYARNFLLPQKKALRATDDNKAHFERERGALEKINDERRSNAEAHSGDVEGRDYVLIRQASDTLQLYGSVNARDIADVMSQSGLAVTRQQVRLDRPIKTLGMHDVRVALHPEVIVTIKANVARSDEEAAIQARGGVIMPLGEEAQPEEPVVSKEELMENPPEEPDSESAPAAEAQSADEPEQSEAKPTEGDEEKSAAQDEPSSGG